MNASIQSQNRPPYGIIAVLLIGAFIALLNETLLNIALPSIMSDLSIEMSSVQWLTNGYMLVNGILIPTTAFLIRKYSARHLFLIAMGLFTIGTILAGFAHAFPVLLAARMIQAAGSAIMMPLLMNVILVSFPVEKRGGAMGLFGLVMIFAPAVGPTLSGWIVEHYSWRLLFHLVSPIALIVLAIGFFKLKDVKEKTYEKLDKLSLILSSFAFGGLLYGFSTSGDKGWDSPEVYGTLIIGAISLILFIWRQMKMEEPMLDFSIYKFPMFTLSSVISIVITMAMFSAMLLLPVYLQDLRGISPMDAGLLMLPGAIIMGIMSPITGKLFDKFGAKVLAIIGLSITVVTTYFFSQLTFETSYTQLIIMYSARMFGMSMVMMPVMTNGLNQLSARYYPHGTAMNSTLQQVSGAIGSAILVSVMSNHAEKRGEELAADAMSQMTAQPTAEVMEQMEAQISAQAMLDGINFSFIFSVALLVVSLILVFFIKRATPPEEKLGSEMQGKPEQKLEHGTIPVVE